MTHPQLGYDWPNGRSVHPRHRRPLGVEPVQLTEKRLETVAFLCVEEKTEAGLLVVPRATVFFIADPTVERPHPVWAVTARHCIHEARAGGGAMFVRVNAGDSYRDIPTQADDWLESDDADVACCYWASTEGDVIAVPVTQLVGANYTYRFGHLLVGDPNGPEPEDVYVGAEVFFVGLFSQHAGRARNLPVARFGNVSRLPREPILVDRPTGTESIDGYLVEARSWGGHSGSPTYWAHPVTQIMELPKPLAGNRAQRRQAERSGQQETLTVSRQQPLMALLGLVSAHFDIPREATMTGDILGKAVTKLNSGMAVVTPAHFIRQLLEREDVRAQAEEYRRKQDPEPAATMDILGIDAERPAGADIAEPTEFERFEELARQLAQTPKPENG